MNKRIRKKRLIGEFVQLGFTLRGQFDGANKEAFVQELVHFAEETVGLDLALSVAMANGHFDLVATGSHGHATREDAADLQTFLAGKGVKNVEFIPPKTGLPARTAAR